VGIFVTVVWAALVFATYGVLATLLDRDPIELPVGPFYGILALAVAALVVYLGIQLTTPSRSPWLGALGTGAAVYLVIVVAAGIVDFALAVAQALSPFVLAASVLAAATVVAVWAVFARRR
jgi:hypothetical protein